MDKVTWLVLIFDDVKGGGEGKDCEGSALLCHLDKKVVRDEFVNAGDSADTFTRCAGAGGTPGRIQYVEMKIRPFQ